MKRIIDDENGKAMENLLGEVVTIFACRYIYTGKLTGIGEFEIELSDPSIVYETGPFDKKEWGDVQKLPHDKWYIALGSIESFGIMK